MKKREEEKWTRVGRAKLRFDNEEEKYRKLAERNGDKGGSRARGGGWKISGHSARGVYTYRKTLKREAGGDGWSTATTRVASAHWRESKTNKWR